MSVRTLWACFNAESLWKSACFTSLPSFTHEAQDRQHHFLDEILVPQQPGDRILTLVKPDSSLSSYHQSIGAGFYRESLCEDLQSWEENGAPNWRSLPVPCGLISETMSQGKQSPFANVPSAYQGVFSSDHLPDYQDVVKVNDKRYAVDCCHRLGIKSYGTNLQSSSCLAALETHSLPLILKEPFGVSGKGSLVIKHPAILARICDHLKKQMQHGKQLALTVEPFLEKALDFSSQWKISEDGTVTFISYSEILNEHLKFSGVRQPSSALIERIESVGYRAQLEPLLATMFKDGYWGAVCIDSMLLQDGTVVPVVEINARESMGSLAHRWFECLELPSEALFQQYTIKYDAPIDMGALLNTLNEMNALYNKGMKSGVIPLNSLCLQAPDNGEPNNMGRCYMISLGLSAAAVSEVLTEAFQSQGAMVQ
ncbi:hypothetical protein [Veronia pacifica]|uniref:ATP-grasp domain-containing protein n=1 Tax=Veronia pacifica TaxID=1080227 RepID=A0A1C3EIJ2_9GAMM|nr:hypothetical protein [Veronia pacifica]ODA33061.1 hypothetical protein A8L45_11490 [Veronia pacifica]